MVSLTRKRISKMETQIKRVLIRTVFVLMVATAFALAVPTNVSAATITVPDDYSTIQQAINAASAGDTVYVRSGTYYEHVTIGKSLTLQGENRDTTIIDGSGTGDVIQVTGDKVNFNELTVHNGDFGIQLQSSDHDTISNMIISNHTFYGVGVHGSCYNLIIDCSLTNCGSGIALWAGSHNNTYENCEASYSPSGFHVGWGHYNLVKNCKAWNCSRGIDLDSCWYARVENCDVWSNAAGIVLHSWGSAKYNTITECNAYSNGIGIHVYDQQSHGGYNEIYRNDFMNNTQFQAVDEQYYPNEWDDGYPSGGNYWGDYTGVDNYSGVNQDQPGSDGIGDTPYIIPGTATSRDNYPLMISNYVPQALADLVDDVVDLNLQQGISNSLDMKLDAVSKALEDVNENNDVAAINALGAFINAVQAQRGNKISEDDADALIATAQQIIDLITAG
jgi:nitrous oxidase accessory protein NosD